MNFKALVSPEFTAYGVQITWAQRKSFCYIALYFHGTCKNWQWFKPHY